MKKKKELKNEIELDIEFEVDKNNRVDMKQVIELVIAYNKLFRTYKQLKTQIGDISEELELVRCDLHNRTSERDSYESELNECLSQQKEFIEYLENEKDRLIHETSHHYTDSFDRQHSVNETIYDEVDKISIKYKEIIGGKDENNL